MHSLLAAPAPRAHCGAAGTQAGKQQAHRHRWLSFNDHHRRQVGHWLERRRERLEMDRDGRSGHSMQMHLG
ncbi:hypothetical protein CesoFtcFv8_009409 [Champsocephalus esox]|uniref:Uncharacterized protein n=1 Tax=Champsocephalus esox TaxID=159716 RepID=A0AAN8H2F9_9TELE|nr:hypothetical protein CesoFtcFv8_009409 [Champsocephalus esox]